MSRSPAVAYLEISQRGGGAAKKNFSDGDQRTPNVDVKLFDDLFFTYFCYFQPVTTPPFLYIFSSFLPPAHHRPHKRKEKFFSSPTAGRSPKRSP
jgi:hypothetical protein